MTLEDRIKELEAENAALRNTIEVLKPEAPRHIQGDYDDRCKCGHLRTQHDFNERPACHGNDETKSPKKWGSKYVRCGCRNYKRRV